MPGQTIGRRERQRRVALGDPFECQARVQGAGIDPGREQAPGLGVVARPVSQLGRADVGQEDRKSVGRERVLMPV